MKRITLISYGKVKTPGIRETLDEFEKRISKYCDWTSTELKAEVVPDKTPTVRAQVQEKEAQKLTELLQSPNFKLKSGKNAALWFLDESGKSLKTREMATEFLKLETQHFGELIFVIGGGLGLFSTGNFCLALGPQTLPHDLARLVLTEQIYRVLSLNAGHPYHNES
jgi:23S rRNA (pseudouridine1915-N3)-methyltransferase